MTEDYKVTDAKWEQWWPEFLTFWNQGDWVFGLQAASGDWFDYIVEGSGD
jgi:hypothetical protein